MEFTCDKKLTRRNCCKQKNILGEKQSMPQDGTDFMTHSKQENRKKAGNFTSCHYLRQKH
jgi:hypothetical protein